MSEQENMSIKLILFFKITFYNMRFKGLILDAGSGAGMTSLGQIAKIGFL